MYIPRPDADVVALGQSEQGDGKGQHKIIVLAFGRVDRRGAGANLLDPELPQLAAQNLSSGSAVDEYRTSHFPIGLLATSQWPLQVGSSPAIHADADEDDRRTRVSRSMPSFASLHQRNGRNVARTPPITAPTLPSLTNASSAAVSEADMH
jgi:hypothetical protein